MTQTVLPDLSFVSQESFLDRDRVAHVLRAENLSALVVAEGRNVFHATQYFPLLEKMSLEASALAVIPANPKQAIALVIPAFSYYYIQADDGLPPGVVPFVFTSSADPAPRMHRLEGTEMPAREAQRRQAISAAAPYTTDLTAALSRALAELGITSSAGARIGYDHSALPGWLSRAAPTSQLIFTEDTPRRLRLVRTPAEIRMMRLASKANVDAASATLRAARELGSLRAVRQRFFADVAARGNTPVFMVVNGASSEAYDEPLREGSAFMVDCVSQLRYFHGDYGRTVFIGEPPARMQRCTQVMATVWRALQEELKPGLRFSEVANAGRRLLKKIGPDVPMSFNTHSVGLAHTDQPRLDLNGNRADPLIEKNMILSIDCPLFETGLGGTAHLEDLVLITDSGAEAIHETAPATLLV
jgi:Xaa-Pro aminopeptidase